jgi:hypothetical protein
MEKSICPNFALPAVNLKKNGLGLPAGINPII